jgi:hypothetical protein
MTQFGTLNPDGTLTNVRVIKQGDLLKCPHVILVADHYREDGRCRCDDPAHRVMKTWGYKWSSKKGRWV